MIKDILLNFGAGLVVGGVFLLIKLPVPAPPVIPPVFAILGITCGYIGLGKLLGW